MWFINYYIICHTNNCTPTFALPFFRNGLAAYKFTREVIPQPEISAFSSPLPWMVSQPPTTGLSPMQHQHHLGNWKIYKFSGITQAHWVVRDSGSGACNLIFNKPPGDSDAHRSLKTTGLEYNPAACSGQIILTFRARGAIEIQPFHFTNMEPNFRDQEFNHLCKFCKKPYFTKLLWQLMR